MISVADATSRADIRETLRFEGLKLMTFDEEMLYSRFGRYNHVIINPQISLIIYKEKNTDNTNTFTYKTLHNIYNATYNFGSNIYDAIAFTFNQMLFLNLIDFAKLDNLAGLLFYRFNHSLEKVAQCIVEDTSITNAIRIADKIGGSLPFDYALGQNFFDVVNLPIVKHIYIIPQPKIFNFMKALSEKYKYIAKLFAQIILFKIFKEINRKRIYFSSEVSKDRFVPIFGTN
jgi:hypothetical protein